MKKEGIFRILSALLLVLAVLLCGCENMSGEEGNESGENPTEADVRFMVNNALYARFSEGGVPADPEKQGFRFDGWYLDKGEWKQRVDVSSWNNFDEVSLLLGEIDPGEDVTLWARFVEVPPEGFLPGKLCYAADIPLFEGESDAASFNVSGAGKVTVLNFWGTWCGPCKAELPHFDKVAREYGDRIVMVAIHSNQGIANAPAYIAEHFADSPIIFGHDDAQDSYFLRMGGYAYPLTVVVDADGIIVANQTGQLTEAHLKELLDEALA